MEKDRLRQNAIIRELEVIEEAAQNIPENFRAFHPDIAWKQIAGMRDKLIHHYFGINLNIIWDVLKADLPELKKKMQEILEDKE